MDSWGGGAMLALWRVYTIEFFPILRKGKSEWIVNLCAIYCSANMYHSNIVIYAGTLMDFIYVQRSQLLALAETR